MGMLTSGWEKASGPCNRAGREGKDGADYGIETGAIFDQGPFEPKIPRGSVQPALARKYVAALAFFVSKSLS